MHYWDDKGVNLVFQDNGRWSLWQGYGDRCVASSSDGKSVLMWGTGLKDKNGKMIYKKDIPRVWEEDEHVPNYDSGGGIIDFDIIEGFSQLGVVDFKGAWFTYETKKHQKGREVNIFAPLDFTRNLEVVGDIFQNPELLEGME
ncbi:YopX family protein [Bacillus sp. S17B2]|nr:YopX family protein [Bacillus sp. S17B2]